jgi:enterobactin synthetase component F
MAEKLSTLPNAWSVAHYVELDGELDAPLLAKAIKEGLAQADTLRMRFTEDNGEVWQQLDDDSVFALPQIIDVRHHADPHAAALALMQTDLAQELRVDSGKPLFCHVLIQVDNHRWFWYQRYHHCW